MKTEKEDITAVSDDKGLVAIIRTQPREGAQVWKVERADEGFVSKLINKEEGALT